MRNDEFLEIPLSCLSTSLYGYYEVKIFLVSFLL